MEVLKKTKKNTRKLRLTIKKKLSVAYKKQRWFIEFKPYKTSRKKKRNCEGGEIQEFTYMKIWVG